MYEGRPNRPPPPRPPPIQSPQVDPNNLLMHNHNMFYPNPSFQLQNPSFYYQQNPTLPYFFPQNPNFFPQVHNFVAQDPNFNNQSSNFNPQHTSSVSFRPLQNSLQNSVVESGGAAGRTVPTTLWNPPPNPPSVGVQHKKIKTEKSTNAGGGQNEPGETGSSSKFLVPKAKFSVPNDSVPPQKPNNTQSQRRDNKSIDKIEKAVVKARGKLLAAGEHVSAWNVSAAVLKKLKVNSWSSLGCQMQEVPSLDQLMAIEGKINSFINCFVAVRRITSLHDLEVAICKNEGVKQFDELELGPLVRHPLVVHYFALSSEVNTVHKISSEDIISYLWVYMSTGNRKEVVAEQFLDFIAKKRSLAIRDELGVRIHSLGLHIGTIREARRLEDGALNKFLEGNFKQKSNKKSKHRPLFSKQKQQLDERFSAISQRMKSFSSVKEDFDGKHIRFDSSSSEENEDNEDASNHGKLTSQSAKSCDRVSSCPYPSLNEERTRLGLKCEMISTAGHSFTYDEITSPRRKKRKRESACLESEPSKLAISADDETGNSDLQFSDQEGFSLVDSSMGTFITTWKEACRDQTIHEVFDRMLQFYNFTTGQKKRLATRQRKRMRSVFLTYPFIGLLNVAITSIKHGMWDSIYDTLHAGNHEFTELVSASSPRYESIDVEPSAKNESISDLRQSVSIEDIITKLTVYFEGDTEISSNEKSHLDRQLILLGKLCRCEVWIAEQFAAKEFKTLGHGDFITFLQKNVSLLPSVLVNNFVGYIHEKSPFRVCILENQLHVILAQALDSSWEDEAITTQKVFLLLMRQFPSISFNIPENGLTEDFFNNLRDQRSSAIAKCVRFSATFSGTFDYGNALARDGTDLYDVTGVKTELGSNAGGRGPVSFDDAMEVLLRAPMLSDLHVWSHWDLIFAPSLGPLVGWVLNEVNSKELLCLVTKEGKVVRINPSATLDSYLEAALQGAPFRTAAELISLFSLYGGKRHLPSSLLKSHTHQAFKVIIKNSGENIGVADAKLNSADRAIPVASRFFLDCLGYLPSEFRNFAADVLLFGLRSIIKDAPSSILCECNNIEQRVMLHDIGLALGIVEWIDDYYTVRSTSTDPLNPSGISCLLPPTSKLTTSLFHGHTTSNKLSSSKSDTQILAEADCHTSSNNIGNDCLRNASEQYEHKDASFIIESIRREEFGLDTNASETQSSMLKKQHARLGRALHCLSQELYSQDSHFLLELVQNADDNVYHENMEPTLTFILRETGIIVLNNERGFSSHNIRALCDIGNSTKKGSGAGYIGQKGIGFKSVFRVTDAPEIHSNGFHVKFDISEGQIGFVLPTEVPPCSIDLFGKMVSENAEKSNASCWNTCIVLPFGKKLLERAAVNSIISMFSDLHPSLLLFLHRLRCIKFRNLLDDSLVVMRKEHVGDGIIKVSHGSEKMTWLAVSRTLQADGIRPDVQTTEIALAFTLGELEDGVYAAHLELQPVFAFLPLRAYGLKFILQGDFVLPSSREEVDGNSPWNQWLLSEFPDLFISAEGSFCDLPCFRTNKGKAVSAYMSFVPLTGEVHGFFSCLPRMIISKLRMSNCLLLEDDRDTWVPPCRAVRRWNEKARILLPNSILRDRLGLGLLNKNIILSDPLARALGIEDYGPKILLKVLSSLSLEENGLKSMGIAWLGSWLNELYVLSFHSAGHGSVKTELESDILDSLRKIPFIPLSDGTYVSVDEGTVWLHSEASSSGFDCEHGPRTFPNLYANLRMVNPDLLVSTGSTMFCEDTSLADNVTRVLHRIGVQRLSEHEIVKVHILPSMSTEMITNRDNSLMTEYLAFVMLHLQSGCLDCRIEKGYLISDLRNKAFISTSYGYKRLVEVPIHLGKEYGNPVKVNKLIDGLDLKWHEVDAAYLTCPSTKSLSSRLTGWRNFFQELGITDFIDVVQREKSIIDMSHSLNRLFSDGEIVSLDSIAMDWESDEMFKLLSLLSLNGDPKRCQYMLEVLDTFWDSSYGDKTVGFCNSKARGDSKSFKSTFMHSICDVSWVVSSMDDELHYPKDLFHDCDTVRSVLGTFAPYAVPKVKNEKLLGEIGFKTQVTLDDIFSILQVWRRSGTPFHASIAQMSRFYTFVWNELSTSRPKIMSELRSGPYIFVPFARVLKHEDIVPGILLSAEDVYWHDSTGSIEQMKIINPSSECTDVTFGPSPNILSTVYPGLHDFFVNDCGVDESPPFLSYLQILLQLSSVGLPSNSANAVFQVLLKWADGMKSGLLGSDDIVHLRESLLNKETTILPTVQDKWVSLHMSFGLVCWCDDDNLKKEFKHSDNIDFIYFGELNNDDKELLQGKVSVILKALGIPFISEVVTREAIYDGTQDSSFKASLVNWALPYAQRYIYNIHPLRYGQLKQTEFGNLNNLQVSVVDSLCSRNVIKRCDIASKKRSECNSLLQGNILFTKAESDSHSVFMELSRLFFDGTPELHLANFLHMITTMVESGSNEEQLEFFILNSQNLPKLADKDDSVWALSSTDNNEMLRTNPSTISNKEENPSKPKKKRGLTWNWPPANWKTAPDMNFARTNGYRTQATPVSQQNSYTPQEKFEAIDIDANWTIEDASMVPTASSILPHIEALVDPATDSTVDVKLDAVNASSPSDDPEDDSSIFSRRDQVNTGNPNPQQAMLTGRLGETIASKYFKDLMGNAVVKWVNEFNETGLPYDIMIEEQGKTREYIEVKATTSARKDWFIISTREWQFAAEKGDSYSIAHVALLANNKAKITTFRNPLKLCQQGQLQLLVMMPKEQREFALVER